MFTLAGVFVVRGVRREADRRALEATLSDLLSQPSPSLDHLAARLNAVDHWDKAVVFAPYRREAEFMAANPSLSHVAAELASISGDQECWHLALLDPAGNLLAVTSLNWQIASPPASTVEVIQRAPPAAH